MKIHGFPRNFDGLSHEIWWFFSGHLMVFLMKIHGFSLENWCFFSKQKNLGTLMVSKGNHPQMMCGWFVSAMFTLVNYYKIQPDLMVFPSLWRFLSVSLGENHQIWCLITILLRFCVQLNWLFLWWMTTHLYSKQFRVMFRLSTINPMMFAMTSLP